MPSSFRPGEQQEAPRRRGLRTCTVCGLNGSTAPCASSWLLAKAGPQRVQEQAGQEQDPEGGGGGEGEALGAPALDGDGVVWGRQLPEAGQEGAAVGLQPGLELGGDGEADRGRARLGDLVGG